MTVTVVWTTEQIIGKKKNRSQNLQRIGRFLKTTAHHEKYLTDEELCLNT